MMIRTEIYNEIDLVELNYSFSKYIRINCQMGLIIGQEARLSGWPGPYLASPGLKAYALAGCTWEKFQARVGNIGHCLPGGFRTGK